MSQESEIIPRTYNLDEAFAYCERVTNAHYENFPVASLFLPEEKRPYIQAIYAFSRAADDFADEPGREKEERLRELDDWEERLRRCYEGEADHPVFIALGETVRRLEIPIEPLRDLLTAFRRDVTQSRYETFEDLLIYCGCSANPVGRLVLMILGYRDEKLYGLSDHICTALQLANFWQDVEVDLRKDRIYLPLEDMARYGCTPEGLKSGTVDEGFRRLMAFEAERTRELFYLGAELPSLVERDLRLELKLIWFGGMAILDKLKRSGYDVFRRRPSLHAADKAMILARGLMRNDLTRYRKKREPWDLT